MKNCALSKGKIVYPHRFASKARSWTNIPSRRELMRALAGGSLAAVVGWPRSAPEVVAKNNNRQKHRKSGKNKHQVTGPRLPVNRFGCLDIGQPCRGSNANCCSGICQGGRPKRGRPDTSTCVSHDTGSCTPAMDVCAVDIKVPCNPNNKNAFCALTTGNAGFCGDLPILTATTPANPCRTCSLDTDCQAEFGAGSACVVFGGACAGSCPDTGGTGCVPPGI